MMKAMVITGHGSPDEVFRLTELPDPTVGAYDLLIQVAATSVNPVDCKVRQNSTVPRQFPLILGYDVSGTVLATGDCVTDFKPGDEIYASPNVFKPGANAEYVVVDSRSATIKPQTLDHAASAVLPLVSLTAWECLHLRAKVKPGQVILIHAGAGGVGHIAVQLAKLHGCYVITTAGREESIQFCQDSLKANVVINYRTTDFVQQIMELTNGKRCPVILDLVGGETFVQSLDCIAVNGQIVTIVPTETSRIAEKLFLKNVTLHYEFMGIPTAYNINPEQQGKILAALRNLIDDGFVKPHIAHQFPMIDLPNAHHLQETGHMIGKIAIMP